MNLFVWEADVRISINISRGFRGTDRKGVWGSDRLSRSWLATSYGIRESDPSYQVEYHTIDVGILFLVS